MNFSFDAGVLLWLGLPDFSSLVGPQQLRQPNTSLASSTQLPWSLGLSCSCIFGPLHMLADSSLFSSQVLFFWSQFGGLPPQEPFPDINHLWPTTSSTLLPLPKPKKGRAVASYSCPTYHSF